MKVTYCGIEYELDDEEAEALAAFGPDVADGSMTGDEAVACVLFADRGEVASRE